MVKLDFYYNLICNVLVINDYNLIYFIWTEVFRLTC